jgi:hypothetical protein
VTTPTLIAASPPAPALDIDTRLALCLAEMDERCTLALLAIDINTAHLPAADPIPDITESVPVIPLTPTLAPAANPYDTPLAALLHRARIHLETHGWLRGSLRDDNAVARCPMGALRIQAATRRDADDACVLLLDAIQQDFADAETIPSWNDAQDGPALPLLYLDKAAQLAHNRNL